MLVYLNVIVKAGQPSTHFQPWWVEDGSERGPSDMHWPFQGKQEQIPAGRQKPFSDRESTIAVKACLHIAFVCSHWTKQRRHKATLILYCDWDPDPPFIVESKTFFLLKIASHIRHQWKVDSGSGRGRGMLARKGWLSHGYVSKLNLVILYPIQILLEIASHNHSQQPELPGSRCLGQTLFLGGSVMKSRWCTMVLLLAVFSEERWALSLHRMQNPNPIW